MNHAKRLGDLALSDTGFAFDPRSGATFTINPTGLEVLTALKEGLRPDAIVARLRACFDARSADVSRDVDDFTAQLRQHGLVSDDDASR